MFQYAACRTIAEKRDGNEKCYYREGKTEYDDNIEKVEDFTCLIGFFQSEKYFDNDKARQWFKIVPERDKHADAIMAEYPIEEYCYMNLRGTDVKELGCQKLFLDYYNLAREKILSINPNLKFIVVTDDPPFGWKYFPDYPVMCNSVRTDFLLLNKAKYLILANSSFSWWAAWLNLNNIVIAPQGWLNVNVNKWEFGPKDIKVDRFIWV
jgi:hypothetical protein